MIAERKREYFTYVDYCKWDDGNRWELIDGVPYAMSSPSSNHQRTLLSLGWKFREHLEGKECEVFVAPFDVRLNVDKADNVVVQPDLLVVCDPDKIGENSCDGAPDLVIEVLSPSTAKHDLTTKFVKYREAGVRELWFVDPALYTVLVYKWSNGLYIADNYGSDDKINVGILPDLTIDMRDIFAANESGSSE